jgi:hypothetical protein
MLHSLIFSAAGSHIPVFVSGSLSGSGSLSVHTGATVVSMTGRGGTGGNNYYYDPGQPYIAPTYSWSSGSTSSVTNSTSSYGASSDPGPSGTPTGSGQNTTSYWTVMNTAPVSSYWNVTQGYTAYQSNYASAAVPPSYYWVSGPWGEIAITYSDDPYYMLFIQPSQTPPTALGQSCTDSFATANSNGSGPYVVHTYEYHYTSAYDPGTPATYNEWSWGYAASSSYYSSSPAYASSDPPPTPTYTGQTYTSHYSTLNSYTPGNYTNYTHSWSSYTSNAGQSYIGPSSGGGDYYGPSTTATLNGTTMTCQGGLGSGVVGSQVVQNLSSTGLGQTLTYSIGSGGSLSYSYTY